MIKVGDIVKIVNLGEQFTTYCNFFEYNREKIIDSEVSLKDIAHYGNLCYCDENSNLFYCDENTEYKVLFIGNHENDCYDDIAFIKDDCDNVFLFEVNGLRKVKTRMTKEEIEKELGYEIEII